MISVEKDFDDIPEALLNSKRGYMHSSVKDRLKSIYHNKCAYCEVKLKSRPKEEGRVDHYRPVKLYPWLENEWSNLLWACIRCNAAVGASFPIEGIRSKEPEGFAKLEENRADSKHLLGEIPSLLNPELDIPEKHFSFDHQGILLPSSITELGGLVITIFELNRVSLVQSRKEKIKDFQELFHKKFLKFITDYKKIENRRVDGKLIHEILFKEIFAKLK